MIAESAVDPKVLNLVEQVSWRAAAASARGIFLERVCSAAHGARFELVIPLKAPERDKAHRSR